jgi:pectate lyase-like protein
MRATRATDAPNWGIARSAQKLGVFHQAARVGTSTVAALGTAIALVLFPIPVLAVSYYPLGLDDAKAVYLTREHFPVQGNGVDDDTESIQQAINKVQDTTNQGILFIPAGRYRLTRTIYIWPGIRLIGYGSSRPVFVLAPPAPVPDPPTRRGQHPVFKPRLPMPIQARSTRPLAMSTSKSERAIRARWG